MPIMPIVLQILDVKKIPINYQQMIFIMIKIENYYLILMILILIMASYHLRGKFLMVNVVLNLVTEPVTTIPVIAIHLVVI